MNYVINITEREVVEEMSKELAKVLNSRFSNVAYRMKLKLQDLIGYAIINSREYQAMQPGGPLHGEIGIPSTALNYVLGSIIGTIVKNAEVHFLRFLPEYLIRGKLTGGIEVSILRSDFSDVLGLPEASFISEHGFHVEWLRYLLLEGTNTVINKYDFSLGTFDLERTDKGYHIIPVSFAERSRTGTGIMVHSRTGWSVPAEYAGTASDNWLSRALSTVEVPIQEMLSQEIENQVNK